MLWLLQKSVFEELDAAMASPNRPTIAEQDEYTAEINAAEVPRILATSSDAATISIKGVITDAPNLMARFFGGGNTTYPEIRAALAIANNDSNVRAIDLDIDSPGGQASAEWVETMDAIKNSVKPVRAKVNGMAASAAYGIASQAGEIVAQNRMSMVGSVGVMATMRKNKDVTVITSSNAPNKRPDTDTEEGQAVIRERLDAMEKIFIDAIAEGRGVSSEKVSSEFGRGDAVLAEQALKSGMIDSIGPVTNNTASGGKQKQESNTMDINELQAKHPEVYAACLETGKNSERDRVLAHVHLGKECNAADIAFKAIEDGSQVTALLTAQYTTASLNNSDLDARNDDSTSTDITASDKEEKGLDDQVADHLDAMFNFEDGE